MNIIKKLFIFFVLLVFHESIEAAESINAFKYEQSTFEKAKLENKLIIIDFYADWCGPCKLMDRTTYSNDQVIEAMNDYIFIKVNVDEQTDVAAEYNIENLPTVAMLTAEKGRIFVQSGYFDAKSFLQLIQKGNLIFDQLIQLEQKIGQSPDDFDLYIELIEVYIVMQFVNKIPDLVLRAKDKFKDSSEKSLKLMFYDGYSNLLQNNNLKGIDLLKQYLNQSTDEDYKKKTNILIEMGRFHYAEELFQNKNYSEAKPVYQNIFDTTKQPNLLYASKQRLYEINYIEKEASSAT